MASRCKQCKEKLVFASFETREAVKGRFRVKVMGMPVNQCPKGCPGKYWYWADMGMEIDELVEKNPMNLAKKPMLGLFGAKQSCRLCSKELEPLGDEATFRFEGKSNHGSPLTLEITGPAMRCVPCGKAYLPAQDDEHDKYHIELYDAIAAASLKDLISN